MPSPSPKIVSEVDPSFPDHGEAQDKAGGVPTWALPLQTLRRTGLRPFAFHGATVATACGVTPALPYWYELNVHRTASGAYVSDIRLFRKGADEADLFRVAEHGDLDGLLGHLEAYDPSGDLLPASELLDGSGSIAALALRTAQLRIEINQITDHYRSMVCALLGTVLAQAD